MTAHLFNAPGKRFLLVISQDARPVGREIALQSTSKVAAKKEAAKLAAEHGAKPWNF